VTTNIVQRDRTHPFVTKDGSIIRELLAHRNSAIRNQSLAEATVPPGVRTESHHHAVSEEIYYVLSGHGQVRLDGTSHPVGPGDAIAIPPGCVHWIENTGNDDLVFLCCCSPAYEHEDTFLQSEKSLV
jgi:mannose-6-phosphate isomerase-like protein (cupin superfamily)